MADLTNYPGTEDRFTGEILLRRWILEKFGEIYRELGYNLVETPSLEPGELLPNKGGTGLQPVFRFEDTHGSEVCLKPDQTVSLRRVISQHQTFLPFPRHQVGLAFRQDKPERGRLREFTQCDADVIGAPLGIADAETILWLTRGFQAIGLPETILSVNSRQVLTGLYESLGTTFFDELTFVRAVDKLPTDGSTEPIARYLNGLLNAMSESGQAFDLAEGKAAVAAILGKVSGLFDYRNQPVREALSAFVANYPQLEETLASLGKVLDYAALLGVEEDHLRFDPCLARGMDYYTGPVFEARSPLWTYGSLAGGGRYDEMVQVGGVMQPAVGGSFGLERIEQTLKDLDRLPDLKSNLADVLVATREDWLPAPLEIAKSLREMGYRTFVYPNPNDGLGAQTRFAARNGIRAVVFIGPDEREANEVTLRFVSDDKEIKDRKAAGGSKMERISLADPEVLRSAIDKLIQQ